MLDGANPLVAKNRLIDNRAEGIRCAGGAKGRFERNTIQGNGGPGILSEPGCAPTLGENFLTNNAGGTEDVDTGDAQPEPASVD